MSRTAMILGWTMLAALGATMLFWTWGTWPHAYVDFGRELYVPWRLAEGEVLYRDIAWFNGPLSAYRNALLFWIFGEGLLVLVLANLVEVALLVFVLHALVVRVGDRITAVTTCGIFLALFAFARIDAIGNDNYLTPYSHEITQGLLLSLLALLAWAAWRDAPLRRAAACGGLLGLVTLTKAELLVAAVAAFACAVVLEWLRERGVSRSGPSSRVVAAAFAGAWIAPPLVSFGLLSLAMPAADALGGTLGAWPAVLASDVTSQYFYRATLGLLDLGTNIERLFQWALAYAAVALPIVLLTLRIRPVPGSAKFTSGGWMTFTGVFALATLAVVFAGDALGASWPEYARPLPFLMATLAAGSALLATRRPAVPDEAVLRTALLVFATVLLAKVLFRVRLDQYGFALAMPATMLAVTAGVCWLPRWIGRRGGDMGIARAAFLGVVVGAALGLLPAVAARIDERADPIGSGRDAFRTDATSEAVLVPLLEKLSQTGADATVAVLPEGVMLNYLTRRANPTGHVNFMPPELLIFGEATIVESFRESPPDFVVLLHKDTREYGVGFFGRGYGRDLHAWVRDHYETVEQFGDEPLLPTTRFGATLLTRRDSGR